LIAKDQDKDLEQALAAENRRIKEKFYGKAEDFSSRKKTNIHRDLLDYIGGSLDGQSGKEPYLTKNDALLLERA